MSVYSEAVYRGVARLNIELESRIEREMLPIGWRSFCGVVVDVLDCDIIVSEFELLSYYFVHFWTNALAKGMDLLILLAIG